MAVIAASAPAPAGQSMLADRTTSRVWTPAHHAPKTSTLPLAESPSCPWKAPAHRHAFLDFSQTATATSSTMSRSAVRRRKVVAETQLSPHCE